MVLLYRLHDLVEPSRSLLLLVVDDTALRYLVEGAHDRRLDETHRSVNIEVLDPWDQDFFALLD